MRFSERYGYKRVREIVQIDSVDERLRNRLWNVLKVHVWDNSVDYAFSYDPDFDSLSHDFWDDYLGARLDELGGDSNPRAELRDYFFTCEWHEVYDFIEFVAEHYPRHGFREPFLEACNAVLKSELSGYRFVDGTITPVVEPQEIEAIENVLEKAAGPVRAHLRCALELLADRNTSGYRNSIKESISAVESLVASTVGESGTLGQLIRKLEQHIELHPALKNAFSNLYGYTSDEGGIRHALLENETADLDHAKFMLVVCSAFVGFVLGKVAIKS